MRQKDYRSNRAGADRDSDVCLGEGGSVVDAVADHRRARRQPSVGAVPPRVGVGVATPPSRPEEANCPPVAIGQNFAAQNDQPISELQRRVAAAFGFRQVAGLPRLCLTLNPIEGLR
jgi:hypothetical protein